LESNGFWQYACCATAVPFRVFTLNEPDRLVLDFQEVDWRGLSRDKFDDKNTVLDMRFGIFQPGWSRMVLDLAQPMILKTAEMRTGDNPRLTIELKTSSREDFDTASGKTDKDIALDFSTELAAIIRDHTDYQVVLTRDADMSVSLWDRVRFARQVDADLFLSIHSNTVTWGDASGASVYTLSNRASDEASARLAELENRADLSTGFTGHVEGDDVARVLVDLSRVDTNARSKILAQTLIENLNPTVGVLRSKPHRSAGFKVLKAHDIPSVLLELGFMSNDRDLANMQNVLK